MLHGLFQQVLGNVDLHRVLKGLSYLSGQSRHAAENVDGASLNAVFGDKRDILVLDLQRYRHQNCIARHFDEVGSDLERHQVHIDLVADNFFQVLKLHYWRLVDFRHQLDVGELFIVLDLLLRTCVGAARTRIDNSTRLARYAQLLVQRKTAPCVQQRVLLVGIDGQVIVAARTGIDEFQIDVLPDSFDVAIAPILKGIGGSRSTSFVHGTVIRSASRVGVDTVWWTIRDVNVAAI